MGGVPLWLPALPQCSAPANLQSPALPVYLSPLLHLSSATLSLSVSGSGPAILSHVGPRTWPVLATMQHLMKNLGPCGFPLTHTTHPNIGFRERPLVTVALPGSCVSPGEQFSLSHHKIYTMTCATITSSWVGEAIKFPWSQMDQTCEASPICGSPALELTKPAASLVLDSTGLPPEVISGWARACVIWGDHKSDIFRDIPWMLN